MSIYSKNTFIGQRIMLDGNTFEGNIFKDCVLIYGGGPLTFNGNNLQNVRWEFVDAAARTIGLVSSFYRSGGSSKEFVEFLLNNFGTQNVEAPSKEEGQVNG